jgi:hypothetical protein
VVVRRVVWEVVRRVVVWEVVRRVVWEVVRCCRRWCGAEGAGTHPKEEAALHRHHGGKNPCGHRLCVAHGAVERCISTLLVVAKQLGSAELDHRQRELEYGDSVGDVIVRRCVRLAYSHLQRSAAAQVGGEHQLRPPAPEQHRRRGPGQREPAAARQVQHGAPV